MTAKILEGHPLADRLLAEVRSVIDRDLPVERPPSLAIILAGSNPGALAYAARQTAFAERAGVRAVLHQLDEACGLAAVIGMLEKLNADPDVDAILPLFPFPAPIQAMDLALAIDPGKDVDGLHPVNAGRLAVGLPGHAPCTALGAAALADSVVGDFKGVNVTIVGASVSVGRPLAQLMLQRQATVSIAHIATRDLAAVCRTAEVLFVAAGRPGLITADHIRPGAVVVDIGINMVKDPGAGPQGSRIVGDVDLESALAVASIVTAVPDGVGPLTTAFLMANTLRAAKTR